MIIDASVGVKWLIPEIDSPQAMALVGNELLVPALFHSEVANAIWKKARRGELEIGELLPQFPKLRAMTRTLDDATFAEHALALGRELDHPIYDCLYLAAAESLDDIVVTADKRFLRRVETSRYADRVVDLASCEAGE